MDSGFSAPDPSVDTALAEGLADYRSLREQIERNVLPQATSVDGVLFDFQVSLHGLSIRRGGYVILEGDHAPRLGQVTDLDAASLNAATEGLVGAGSAVLVRLALGHGVVLDGGREPFHAVSVRPARLEEVRSWRERNPLPRAGLDIGELLSAPGVPATLDSAGLTRHTFLCGQSGSGKTYALGVLLERVLAETGLRVVILDPNSDFVGLGTIREGADPHLVQQYAHVPDEVAVWRSDPAAEHPLRLRFAELSAETRAAVLGLEPVRDREEYAVLTDLLHAQVEGKPLVSGAEQLLQAEAPGARQLGLRAVNLGVLDWKVWSPELPSLLAELRHPTTRCTVVDLGSLDTPQEQRLVAEAVLSTLWEQRLSRRPCLVVVDEAHNVCPAEPADELVRLSSESAVQIAAEGRKYGLYLLTSTQRPQKVHENVLSQCDNLLLMRMNSASDLADLARTFSFVPGGLIAGATAFDMGEALVAGRLLPEAAYVRIGDRVSEEGGADVPATWAVSGSGAAGLPYSSPQ